MVSPVDPFGYGPLLGWNPVPTGMPGITTAPMGYRYQAHPGYFPYQASDDASSPPSPDPLGKLLSSPPIAGAPPQGNSTMPDNNSGGLLPNIMTQQADPTPKQGFDWGSGNPLWMMLMGLGGGMASGAGQGWGPGLGAGVNNALQYLNMQRMYALKAAELGQTVRGNDIKQQAQNIAGIQAGVTPPSNLQSAPGPINPAQTSMGPVSSLIAGGKIGVPTPMALARSAPLRNATVDAFNQNPDLSQATFPVAQGTQQEFTKGATGKTINSFNTTIQHLGDFMPEIDALGNSNVPLENAVKNWYASNVGGASQQDQAAAVTRFNTNKEALIDEAVSTWRNGGGNESDIVAWHKMADDAQTPRQLNAAMGKLSDLLSGKMQGLQNQYASGVKGTNLNLKILPDENAAILARAKERASWKSPSSTAINSLNKMRSDPNAVKYFESQFGPSAPYLSAQ